MEDETDGRTEENGRDRGGRFINCVRKKVCCRVYGKSYGEVRDRLLASVQNNPMELQNIRDDIKLGMRYFEIDCSTIMAMVSTTLTYIIVLYQFSP